MGEIGTDMAGNRYWKNDNEKFGELWTLPTKGEMQAELALAYLAAHPTPEPTTTK